MGRVLLYFAALVLVSQIASLPSATADQIFKDRDLKGQYGFSFDGTVGGMPVAAIGALQADGDGNIAKGVRILSIGGTTPVVLTHTFTCTYAVNPDGTGSANCLVIETGGTERFAFVLVNNGRELAFVGTDVGVVVRGHTVRQD